jgi:phosphoribosyl-ATP pyrophosphohydrolase/phosphoribosyl-AMP cyclohydrolase
LQLKFDDRGLIPAVVQDEDTREVLMVAYMNAESVRRTLESGDAWFWSRSRQELWHKGDTSGNYQHVVRARTDCDADTILLEVNPDGPACHTGAVSCFYEEIDEPDAAAAKPQESAAGAEIIQELAGVIAQRHATMPEGSYVAGLLQAGIDRVAKKVGEEAAETIIAGKNGSHDEIVWEVADLWFHSLILLEATGVPVEDVFQELARRRK